MTEHSKIKFSNAHMFRLEGQLLDSAMQLYEQRKSNSAPKSRRNIAADFDLKAVTVIDYYQDGNPRAYRVTPTICYKEPRQNESPVFYVTCPVGYDGDYYIPSEGKSLTPEDQEKIENILTCGGHDDPNFLVQSSIHGIRIPDDYDEQTSLHQFSTPALVGFSFYQKTPPSFLNKLMNYFGQKAQDMISFEVDGVTYVAVEEKYKNSLPPHYKQIPYNQYAWMRANYHDSLMGITPPPSREQFTIREKTNIECSPS